MRILAADFGEARTGLAVCDTMETLASPVGTLFEKNSARVAELTAKAAEENRAGLIVIGLPVNMDGTEGERAKRCRAFADMVREHTSLPVELWDERGTTKTAIAYMNETDTRGKKRKDNLDSAAAAIILENYLTYRKNSKVNT